MLAQEFFARSVLDMCPDAASNKKLDSRKETEKLIQESLGEDEADREKIVSVAGAAAGAGDLTRLHVSFISCHHKNKTV